MSGRAPDAPVPAGNPPGGGRAGAGPGFALWFTGLPGSGKSTVARLVAQALAGRGLRVEHLEMDALRRAWFPDPAYDAAEREEAYRRFVAQAAILAQGGAAVLMDATAHRLAWRQAAQRAIPRFAEVFLRTDLQTAAAREAARPGGLVMAGLYAKALERRRTGREEPGLGPVVGVDVAFEENPGAALVLEAGTLTPAECRDRVLEWAQGWVEAVAPPGGAPEGVDPGGA